MITVIRRGMKSRVYKGLLLVIALALAGAFSLPGIIKMAMSKTEWVIDINGTKVDRNDLVRAIMGQQELVEIFRTYYGENAELFAQLMGLVLNPEVLAFDKIVRDTLLDQATQKLFIAVDREYISQQLHNLPFLQQETPSLVPRYIIGPQGIEMNRLRNHLQKIGLTTADFEDRIEHALERSMTLVFVQHASYTLESEVKNRFIRENSGKKFTLLTIPMSTFLKKVKEQEVSQQELKTFFDAKNSKEKRYWVPERRAGIVWEITPRMYGITVSNEQIEKYYNDNKARYFVESPTKVTVRRIVFNNKQEATNARQKFIADPASFANDAESIATFSKNTHERDFEKAAFLLKNDGDFSPVIKTSKGFEIIQRISREPQTYKSFSSVSNSIRDSLLAQSFQHAFEEDVQQLKKRALQDVTVWQKFVDEKGGASKNIESIVNDNSPLAQVLFRLHKDGYSFYFSEGKGFVVKLSYIDKRHLPSLALLQERVTEDLYQERALTAMQEQFAQLKQESQGKSFQEIAKDLDAKVRTTDWINTKDQETLQKLTAEGVPTTQLLQLEKIGAVVEFTTGKEGHLGRLDDIQAFDEQLFNAQKTQLRRMQLKDAYQISQQAFVASLYRNATIKTNESYNYNQQ
ncbi:SurA N-terminal domain-containing protein [Candidatus Dependentiae bacterium]|nr:SurA N-terminal domain-containing protein [Candidatus Dependentiae bacterium]